MKVVGKYCKRFPVAIRRRCREVTSNYVSDEEFVNYAFFNSDNVAIGGVRIKCDSFKLVKDKPLFAIYIDSFEVCDIERGKGYGTAMYRWIEKKLPIYRIELAHRTFDIDDKRSYNFWRKMGFHKTNTWNNLMVKRIV